MRRLLATMLIFALATAVRAETRTWTSSSGRFSTEAELIDFNDGKAHLKKADGKVIEVPLSSLCEEDRALIKKQFPGVEEAHIRPGVEYREWTSKSGKFKIMGEFLGVSEGKVRIRKSDGTEINVELAKLSTADQRFAADELKQQSEAEKESPAMEEAGDEKLTEKLAPQDLAMKLVRLEPPKGKARALRATEYYLKLTKPQLFHMQLGERNGDRNEAEFRRIVKTEAKYSAKVPFRGVAKLGGHDYAFALDSVKNVGYDKLYFDLNRDGDLTNDKPLTATNVSAPATGVSQSQFPRVDLKLEAGDKSVDYSFLLSTFCQQTAAESSASVSLYSAVVREGQITQGGKPVQIVLLDHNSNGRFDDTVNVQLVAGNVVPSTADLLLVNPNTKEKLSSDDITLGRDRNYVSKTVCIGKNFYKLEVPPAGDSVKLTPTDLAIGYVTNASPAYRAVVFSNDYGVMMIGGLANQKIPLPEGKWSVASYTIDATGFTGSARTAITATFGGRPSSVEVKNGETSQLPFGAPFKGVVTASRAAGNKVYLSLAIQGSAGENCTSFYVNGSRPPEPHFVIKDSKGSVVYQGAFEYG